MTEYISREMEERMADYIFREAAFDAVFGQFCASSDETEAALNAAIEEIRAIPAADVVTIEEHNRVTAENDALKKKVASL